jgi:hypothetical protein
MPLHLFSFVLWSLFHLIWFWKIYISEEKKEKKYKTTYLCNRAGLPSLPLPWAVGPRPASSPRLPAWAVQHRRGPSQPEPAAAPLPPFFHWQVGPGCQMLLLAHVTEPVTNP